MNKFLQKLAKIFLGLSMAAGVGVAIGASKAGAGRVDAADTIITFADQGWSNGSTHADFTVSNFRFLKSGSGNAPAYYTSDSTLRFYNGNTLTISSTNGASITAVSSSPSKTFTISNGEATISFSATTRFTSITVTYTADSQKTATTTSVSAVSPSLAPGETTTLSATVSYSGGTITNPGVTYSSNNTSVATVSGNTVTAVSAGTATITGSYAGDNTYAASSGSVTITVVKQTVTGSGTVYFGSGSSTGTINVNSTSVSGSDSIGNDWTVTTAGTSSFTPNAAYAQIGSGSKPASSITFTQTFSSTLYVTSIEAKFGGFSGTAGTITVKVDSTSIATGSLSASNDVIVSESGLTTSGSSLVVTVTGISKGVKAYYISYTLSTSAVSTYKVTYDGNDATSGSVPSDSNNYESGDQVTVLGNTGNLEKGGYIFSGWSYDNQTYEEDDTFNMPSSNVTLTAVWTADSLTSVSVSGSMTNTSYTSDSSWNPAGLVVIAHFTSGDADVTQDATFTYYNSSDQVVATPSALGSGSGQTLKVTATYSAVTSAKYVASTTINVFTGVTYDLTKIDEFSSWTTSYGNHSITSSGFSPTVSTAASLDFKITNKQGSGVGSEYPCIGGKTTDEVECLTFTLTESNKKISAVSIVFVTRFTTTYPSLYLHKGSGISSSSISDLTVSGTAGSEHTLSVSNLNDTVFTVGYNAHQTNSNGAVGIKSITIGVEEQQSFGNLDHITVTGLPNVIYHVGETYDSTGFVVTAFDGADEGSANFKDVTALVETDFGDEPYEFVDGDVPGLDIEVSYEGDNGSDTTTFHIYVYALAEYELVTSEPADWSGNYLIVGTNGESELGAMNGGLSNPDVEKGYKIVTEKETNLIEAGQELEWTISSVTGGYSVQGKSGKYIGSLTAKNNGMLVSDTALVNTLSIDSSSVSITGTNSYGLTLNTTGDRFRYYNGGTVKLYRLKVSDNAVLFAQTFLEAFTCDDSGISKPTFTIKEGTTYWSWSLLASEYSNLTPVEKEEFRLGVASESGDDIEKALARYDYVVGKYYVGGLDTTLISSDFMQRSPSAVGTGGSQLLFAATMKNTNTVAIIVIISMVSVTAIGGYFFLRKRKENI